MHRPSWSSSPKRWSRPRAYSQSVQRTTLAQSEIDRIPEFHFATVLVGDEEFTGEGAEADEDLARAIAGQLDEAGIEYDMPAPWTLFLRGGSGRLG